MSNLFTASFQDVVSNAGQRADRVLNETTIRVAVTGLSRAGKTVFITSLLNNLVALGHGQNTLPRLQKVLDGADGSRLISVGVTSAGNETTSYFDYKEKLADLAADHPSWPSRTDHLAQITVQMVIERQSPLWRKLGKRRIRLELLDYPGEWLLDLPLLSKSYAQWSMEALSSMRSPARAPLCAPFLTFLDGLAPGDGAEDVIVRRGHALYVDALNACRSRLGVRHLQPGRFLCPGPNGDAPYLWFFPLDHASDRSAEGSVGSLLAGRYETYKSEIRRDFFDRHFSAFDRQIVLVDVLGALRAGRTAFEDTGRAIADIATSMNYGERYTSPLQDVGAVALRAGKAALGVDVTRPIRRIAFVATKADHVPLLGRKNLENLLRDLVERAGGDRLFHGLPISFHTVASINSTHDGVADIGGRQVEVVRGRLLEGNEEKSFFPGEVPSGWPPESFWSGQFFELPCFKPPRIDPTGKVGIPHLGIDEVLASLLKDAL